jgi:hypothetical protein
VLPQPFHAYPSAALLGGLSSDIPARPSYSVTPCFADALPALPTLPGVLPLYIPAHVQLKSFWEGRCYWNRQENASQPLERCTMKYVISGIFQGTGFSCVWSPRSSRSLPCAIVERLLGRTAAAPGQGAREEVGLVLMKKGEVVKGRCTIAF